MEDTAVVVTVDTVWRLDYTLTQSLHVHLSCKRVELEYLTPVMINHLGLGGNGIVIAERPCVGGEYFTNTSTNIRIKTQHMT